MAQIPDKIKIQYDLIRAQKTLKEQGVFEQDKGTKEKVEKAIADKIKSISAGGKP
jgi:hypothetical protein